MTTNIPTVDQFLTNPNPQSSGGQFTVRIEPELARSLTSLRNKSNRSIDARHRDRLGAEMREGRWDYTTKGTPLVLAFIEETKSHAFAEGHHRLEAAAKHSVGFDTLLTLKYLNSMVEFQDLVLSIDDRKLNKPRSSADTRTILQLWKGDEYNTKLAAKIGELARIWDNGVDGRAQDGVGDRQIREFAYRYDNAARRLSEIMFETEHKQAVRGYIMSGWGLPSLFLVLNLLASEGTAGDEFVKNLFAEADVWYVHRFEEFLNDYRRNSRGGRAYDENNRIEKFCVSERHARERGIIVSTSSRAKPNNVYSRYPMKMLEKFYLAHKEGKEVTQRFRIDLDFYNAPALAGTLAAGL